MCSRPLFTVISNLTRRQISLVPSSIFQDNKQRDLGKIEAFVEICKQTILVETTIFYSPIAVSLTRHRQPEATLPGDQLVAGRSASTVRREEKKDEERGQRPCGERGHPDFERSLLTRKRVVSQGSPSFFVGGVFGTATPLPLGSTV